MARPRRDQSSRMLHVEDRRSLNLQFGAFTVLVFHSVVFLSLIHSCRGQSEVICPSQPIVAVAGEDIILPCYLEPVMNAYTTTVEWSRPDLNPRFVLVWRHGVELVNEKHPSFKGRTSVFTDELKHGNISLKLSTVKISDEGRYRCFTPEQDRYSDIQLVVGAVSSPVIQTTKNSSGVLECESNGWYPEPEVLWLDGEGHVLSAGPTETVRGPDDLYTVSSRVTVERRHGNRFTCRVQQKDINRTRETQIHVPDHFFMVPGPPGPPAAPGHPRVIIGSVIGCAALVTIAAIFVVWKWKQKKLKNKRKSLEDGGEETEEENRVTPRSDNTGFKVVMEGEGESAPLMAGREEENNVDNRGEEDMESQSEHLDHQNVAEGETHQDQLVTKPETTRDMDRAGGQRDMRSINNEKVPLIPAEGQTHRQQDMIGRQVKPDRDQGEGEQTRKPVKEDSRLPMVPVTEEKEETRQEPMTDVDKNKAKSKKKREKKKKKQQKGGVGATGLREQQQNQRERIQPEAERQREENDKKLKQQRGNSSQHLLEDRKQEGREAGREDETETEREGNQRDIRTDRKAEEQIKEKLGGKRDERQNELPSVSREVTEKPNIRIYEGTTGRQNQELQAEKQESETSQRNQEETKEQPEESTEGLKIEPEERREEELETDKGADSDETHKKSKETEEELIEGQQQAEQPSGGEGEVRQQLQECFRFSAGRRAEINRRPQTQRKVKRGKKKQQKKEHHVDWSVRKRKLQEESSVQTEQTSKKLKEEQNDVQMNSGGEEEDVHMEPEVIDETQGQDVNLQLDQALMCQEDQEEPMES